MLVFLLLFGLLDYSNSPLLTKTAVVDFLSFVMLCFISGVKNTIKDIPRCMFLSIIQNWESSNIVNI